MKKTLILELVLCSLLIVTMGFNVAANEITLTDEKDDVYDNNAGKNTDDKPNIDIRKLTYFKEDGTVTLKLTVDGVIEKRGDLEDLRIFIDPEYAEEITSNMTYEEIIEFFANLDFVGYSFELETLGNSYSILYVNDGSFIYDATGKSIMGNHYVEGSALTISFGLSDGLLSGQVFEERKRGSSSSSGIHRFARWGICNQPFPPCLRC